MIEVYSEQRLLLHNTIHEGSGIKEGSRDMHVWKWKSVGEERNKLAARMQEIKKKARTRRDRAKKGLAFRLFPPFFLWEANRWACTFPQKQSWCERCESNEQLWVVSTKSKIIFGWLRMYEWIIELCIHSIIVSLAPVPIPILEKSSKPALPSEKANGSLCQ